MIELMDNNYHMRQAGLIHPSKLGFPIDIIGAGSIGGWTALALLKMGCQDVNVYDFDKVEEQNVGSQCFTVTDIGIDKVIALKEKLFLMTNEQITAVNEKYEKGVHSGDVIIAAVDNMKTRIELFKEHVGQPKWLIDGRMAAHEINLYTVRLDDPADCAFYEKTLFSDEEASPVLCSERSVVYNVYIIGGYITSYVARIANGKKPPLEAIIDLENYMMSIEERG